MKSSRILLFEHESEFALCLQEMLGEIGVEVHVVDSYDRVLEELQSKTANDLICDLLDDDETRLFLDRLGRLDQLPRKTVFTSIYADLSLFPSLKEYRGAYLFMPKPFRVRALMAFLFPQFVSFPQRV